MRKPTIAITSDLHYPWDITENTFLQEKCGYAQEFYRDFEIQLQSLPAHNVQALILGGDLYWNYKHTFNYLQRLKQKPHRLLQGKIFGHNILHSPVGPLKLLNDICYKFIKIRNLVPQDIPILLIEGNHDYWFDSFIFSNQGTLYIDLNFYRDFFKRRFNFPSSLITKILSDLKMEIKKSKDSQNQYDNTESYDENSLTLGNNMYLLRNSGLSVGKFFIYGFPFYDPADFGQGWNPFKNALIETFRKKINTSQQIARENKKTIPKKAILCHHRHPISKDFVEEFKNKEKYKIKGLFWGHYHEISNKYFQQIQQNTLNRCIMPEKNKFQIILID